MQVRVKDETYLIKFIDHNDPNLFLNGNRCLGVSDYKIKTIFIDESLDPYDIETTLAHELFHCLFYESGIELGYDFHSESSVNFLGLNYLDIIKMFKDAGFIDVYENLYKEF